MPKLKGHTYRVVITPEVAGVRLDKALATLLAEQVVGISRARVQALMVDGKISRNGKPETDGSLKVKADDTYAVDIPPPEKAEPEAQDIALKVIFEDEDLLVIDKPVGLVVHPAPGNRDKTLVNALLAHCGKSLSGIGGVARPGIVHRLDKDTSGLMVVAKNDMAHHALTAQFADRSLSRTYQALVWGEVFPLHGSVDAPIGRHTGDRKKMAVTAKASKPALTHYTVVKSLENVTLVECKLATGRTHQIRVHMAYIKHPVVGDATYGKKASSGKANKALYEFPRQALHAIRLEFMHPRTGKKVRFSSDLPADMKKLLRTLARAEK